MMSGLEGGNLLPGVLCPVQDPQHIVSAPQGCCNWAAWGESCWQIFSMRFWRRKLHNLHGTARLFICPSAAWRDFHSSAFPTPQCSFTQVEPPAAVQYRGPKVFLTVEGTFPPLTFLLSLLRFLHVCLESGEETLSPPVLHGELTVQLLVSLKFRFW